MNGAIPLKHTYVEGREDQFREMMQALALLEGKYQGVRGELLSKVRAELAKLKPTATTLRVVATLEEANLAPCRVCGRGMKRTATDGSLVCQNGHRR